MIVNRWTKREVQALRTAALRLTQEEFAEKTGYALATIKKWHRATWNRPLRGRSADVLDILLRGLDTEQLTRFEAEIVASSAQLAHAGDSDPTTLLSEELGLYAWEVHSDVKRRELGKIAAAAAAVSGAGALVGAWEFGEHIGAADVQRLLSGVDALEAQDQLLGGGGLVQFAVQKLARAKHILDTGTYSTATGKAFASATGHLAVQTGWLAYDADFQPLARRCFTDAMALATEADDEDLIARTCLTAANQSITLAREGKGSAHHGLNLAGRARTLMRGRPPGRVHALIAVREAQAHGVLGDRNEFARAITTAWRETEDALTHEPIEDSSQWLRFVDHFEIQGHEGRGWGDLGGWQQAADLLNTPMQSEAGIRNVLVRRAWAATAHVRLGDIPAAIEIGTPVLDQLDTVSSTRALRVLQPVRAAATDAVGAEFCGRFDTLAAHTDQKALEA